MARILYGGGVTDIRGSIGGTTFSRNASGAYARSRVNPTDPSTPAQSQQRQRLSSIAAMWHLLTAGQQQSWRDYATLYYEAVLQGTGLGARTGQQMFMSLNLLALSLNDVSEGEWGLYRNAPSVVSPFPTLVGLPPDPITVKLLVEQGSAVGEVNEVIIRGLEYEAPPGYDLDDYFWMLKLTPGMSPGRRRTRSWDTRLRAIDGQALTPLIDSDVTEAYVDVYSSEMAIPVSTETLGDDQAAGILVGAELRLVRDVTAEASAPIYFTAGVLLNVVPPE